ncbi:hypothetical protein K505DRAFT_337027 [Melanomma pulvis-pyrius CBS 109.77]|uniref:Uncharacterized protein n=1 Tax=Melanomma pulvis-pyrius CBS 109.77 TaxID=1314802 RepID=A0A6A6XCJ1_9PLEO|nr:hypothetical protein K505DRAFT_337027 [Melanomma pulvis-pyrius CBS 109.77]
MSDTPLIKKMPFRKSQTPHQRSPLGLYTSDNMDMNTSTSSLPLPTALENRSVDIMSSNSVYGMDSGTLDTPGTMTSEEAGEADMRSLKRIKKRRSLRPSSPITPLPPNLSHSPAMSFYAPTIFHTQPQADGGVDALLISGNRRTLSSLSSPLMPPQTPSGFYKPTEATENRRRNPLSRKISTRSLQCDIWEGESSSHTEAVSFKDGKAGSLRKDSSELKSLPGSEKKRSVSRSFRRGIDMIMGKPRQGKLPSSSPIDYVAKSETRRQSMEARSSFGSSSIRSGTFAHSLQDSNLSSSTSMSDENLDFTLPDILESPAEVMPRAARRQNGKLGSYSAPTSKFRSRPRSQFVASPLFGEVPTRIQSEDRMMNSDSSSPLSIMQSEKVFASCPGSLSTNDSAEVNKRTGEQDSSMETSKMGLMAPKKVVSHDHEPASNDLTLMAPMVVFSQEPILPSANLSCMETKSIYIQSPVSAPSNLSLMHPTTTFSQTPIAADNPLFVFSIAIILTLGLATTQALIFAFNNAGDEVSSALVEKMLEGYLAGAVLGIFLHVCYRGPASIPRDLVFLVARVVGVLVWLVKAIVCGALDGFRAGTGNGGNSA